MSEFMLPPGADSSQLLRVEPIAALTAPMGATIVEPRYYYHPMRNVSMLRMDGKRISFINNVAECITKEDQAYLDGCISRNEVPHLAYATDEQVQAYKMYVNPKAAIKEQVAAEVRAELLANASSDEDVKKQVYKELLDKLSAEGQEVPEQLLKMLQAENSRPSLASDDGSKVSHVDSATAALSRLKTGGATVTPTNATAAAALGGIQNTSDVKDNSGS